MVGKRGYDRDRYVRSESDRCGDVWSYDPVHNEGRTESL